MHNRQSANKLTLISSAKDNHTFANRGSYMQQIAPQYRALFQQTALGIAFIAVPSWQFLQANQKFLSLVHASNEELMSYTFSQCVAEDTLSSLLRLLTDDESHSTCEMPLQCLDGGLCWARLTFSLERDVTGQPAYLILFADAIQKPTVATRSDRSVSGDVSGGQESVEVGNRELALLEANRRMEEFLGLASHELRTPLTTIKANAQLAIRRLHAVLKQDQTISTFTADKVGSALEMLVRAERQVGVLNRLVSDLIDISRIQTDRLALHIHGEPLDLVALVRDTIQEQHKASPERIIKLDVGVARVPVMVDPDRIAQVIGHYLTNALKYSATDRPIDVRVFVEEQQESAIAYVEVRDQGPGLDLEEQGLVWERFYQSPRVSVASGAGVGLGLGLHISRTLIERHHGSAGVWSVPGEGSTFWFALPLARQEKALEQENVSSIV